MFLQDFFVASPLLRTEPKGPSVQGTVTYTYEGANPAISNSTNINPVTGTIEAYMPLLPNNASLFSADTVSRSVNTTYDFLGTSNITGGNISFPLGFSFYPVADHWNNYYSRLNTSNLKVSGYSLAIASPLVEVSN